MFNDIHHFAVLYNSAPSMDRWKSGHTGGYGDHLFCDCPVTLVLCSPATCVARCVRKSMCDRELTEQDEQTRRATARSTTQRRLAPWPDARVSWTIPTIKPRMVPTTAGWKASQAGLPLFAPWARMAPRPGPQCTATTNSLTMARDGKMMES